MVIMVMLHLSPSRTQIFRTCLRRFSNRPLGSKFNILFLGQDEFSCKVFQHLHEAKDVWKGLTVATNPDAKKGRWRNDIWISPMKTMAKSHRITHHDIPPKELGIKTWKVPEPFTDLSQRDDNMLITASFGHIIPNKILKFFPPTQALNVHGSLLPKYKGPAPIQYAIAQGEKETGVSIMTIAPYREGIDSGSLWGTVAVPIPLDATTMSLRETLAEEGGKLLVSTLRAIVSGTATSIPQDESKASHSHFINRDSALIDWNTWDAPKVDRMHRAIHHQYSLYTYLPNASLQLKELIIRSPPATLHPQLHTPGDAIYDKRTKSIVIRCANDTEINVTRVHKEFKKEMPAFDYWNGLQPESLQDGGILKLASQSAYGIHS